MYRKQKAILKHLVCVVIILSLLTPVFLNWLYRFSMKLGERKLQIGSIQNICLVNLFSYHC